WSIEIKFVEIFVQKSESMADEGKSSHERKTRGQDWEVVSLTASTYAACPGPKKPDESGSRDKDKNESDVKLNENESPASLVQSQHFIFPPSHHEGLPIEKDIGEVTEIKDAKVDSSLENLQGLENVKAVEFSSKADSQGKDSKHREGISGNGEDFDISYNIKPGSSFETFHQSIESLRAAELFGENETQISHIHGKDVEALKGLDWIEPRQCPAVDDDDIGVCTEKLNFFHNKIGGVSCPSTFDESKVLANLQKEVQEQNFSLAKPFSDNVQQANETSLISPKDAEDKKKCGKDHSYEAWLRCQAASLRDQVRQSNALWPIAIAVALTGIVILGHRWQHERWQNQQLRLELGEKEE
ncbi:hypothetical protein KI387_004565, partial [Taxus chinensis]